MLHPRLTTLLVTTVALAAGTALADPPFAPSGAPARGKGPSSQPDQAKAPGDAASTRAERRREHRAKLFQHWGRYLDRAEVLAELRNHAERIARLRRMRFVAETERKGPEREKILARIDKLLEKENARHERAMQRFAAALPAPSGAPAAKSSGVAMPTPPMPITLPSGFKLPPLPAGSALPPLPAVSAKLRRLPAPAASGAKP